MEVDPPFEEQSRDDVSVDAEGQEETDIGCELSSRSKIYQQWYPNQLLMFHAADFYENKFFIAKDTWRLVRDRLSQISSKTWFKIYRSFSNYDEFVEYEKRLKILNCYEVIRTDQALKPFWDLEWLETPDHTSNRVLDVLRVYINRTMVDLFDREVLPSHYRVLTSGQGGRCSLHVILHGWGHLRNTHLEMKTVNEHLVSLLRRDGLLQDVPLKVRKRGCPIDSRVYTRNRLFRMIGHHKSDQTDRVFTKIGGDYPNRDYFVTVDADRSPVASFLPGTRLVDHPDPKPKGGEKHLMLIFDKQLGKFQLNYRTF
jgi:hypothetical protein